MRCAPTEGPSADSPLAQRSPAFIQWCREQMIELRNDPDLSLVEFLLSVTSSGEVADYTEMYLGKSAKVRAQWEITEPKC